MSSEAIRIREEEKQYLEYIAKAEAETANTPSELRAKSISDGMDSLDELMISLGLPVRLTRAIGAYNRIREGKNINQHLDMDRLPFKLKPTSQD